MLEAGLSEGYKKNNENQPVTGECPGDRASTW